MTNYLYDTPVLVTWSPCVGLRLIFNGWLSLTQINKSIIHFDALFIAGCFWSHVIQDKMNAINLTFSHLHSNVLLFGIPRLRLPQKWIENRLFILIYYLLVRLPLCKKKLWRSKNDDGDKKIEDAGAFIVNVIIHSYCLTKQFEILSWNVGNSFGGKIGLQNHVHIIDDVFVHFWRSLSWNFAFGKHFWTLQNKKKEIKDQFKWPCLS